MKTEISLVIVRTGSEKAMISQGSNTGQEEEKVWPGRAILSFTWLKSQQYPNGIKVQVILSQAKDYQQKEGRTKPPNNRQGCTPTLVNLCICRFMEVPPLIARDKRKGLKSQGKISAGAEKQNKNLPQRERAKLCCGNKSSPSSVTKPMT